MDVTAFSSELIAKDGIYFAKNQPEISYPEKGNQLCYQLEENSYWFNHRNKCILAAFKKYASQNLFFDIGGGNGFVSKQLENEGIECVLIEPGVQGCLNAKQRQLKNIVCSTLEEAKFIPNAIPNIGVFDVVEHIENDNQFLKMIHNYLIPNGLVFITVPAYTTLWSNEDIDAGHFRRYTTKTINEKLVNNGFEIVYSGYIFSILTLPILLFRSIPSKLGFNKNTDNINKHQSQHTAKKGFIEKTLNLVWNKEVDFIKKGKKIKTGSSCFVVAKKI